MKLTRPERRVITFYSYKGGVGRSMALANVAYRLADACALDVIAVDWDLESPGLHSYFGLTQEVVAEARGVLDYLEAWGAASQRGEAPPDVRGWLLPIEEGPAAPGYGSLRLLAAGRLDASYRARVAGLSRGALLPSGSAAAAVDDLRKQLVADADVVLVDCRSGLTEMGRLCAVDLPDGVVLMTAPSRQSLQGIEQVARSIAGASAEERAGRSRARVWLSVARISMLEEPYLEAEWFKAHAGWFRRGVKEGLWRKKDHRRGLETMAIPYRSMWSFSEKLAMAAGAVLDEPLVRAYELLAMTLLDWCLLEELPPNLPTAEHEAGLAELREAAAEAGRNGILSERVAAYVELAHRLLWLGQHQEADEVYTQAEALARRYDAHRQLARILLGRARVLEIEEQLEEAALRLEEAAEVAPEADSDADLLEGVAREHLGRVLVNLGRVDEGLAQITEGAACLRRSGDHRRALGALHTRFTGGMLRLAQIEARISAERMFSVSREQRKVASALGLKAKEAEAIQALLELAGEGHPVGDVEELRARLRELGSEDDTEPADQAGQAPGPRAVSAKRKRALKR